MAPSSATVPSLVLPIGAAPDTEVRYRAAFEQSPVSTVVYDSAGRPMAANAAFERLAGMTLADLPEEYTIFDDPRLRAAGVLPLVARAFAGEVVELPPLRNRPGTLHTEPAHDDVVRGDGEQGEGDDGAAGEAVRWTQACLHPVRASDGTVRQVVLTHHDVTARMAVEDALHTARRESEAYAEDAARNAAAERVARKEAEAANRAKSEFLGMMSHELRTPLNAITGYVDILELGLHGPITDEQRDDLQRVRRGAQVLLALVNDVLNFARLEAGRVELHPTDVPLASVLAALEELVLPQLALRGIAHAFDAGTGTGTGAGALSVRADPERLKQILLNLLTNAAKFTAPGGRVTVSCEQAGDVVRVRVADTGRGIPPDKLERIFEPFVQVDRHLTRDSQQGIGLGLAISRDLARRMGGDLVAESEEGKGAVFVLTVPGALNG